MRRFTLALIVLASVAAFCALVFAWYHTTGVRVTVINSGPDPISSVVIHVTGDFHLIGDLAVGQSKTLRLSPTCETGVEISFVDHLGQPHRLNAGGYTDNYDSGTIEVELEHGAIKRNDHNVGTSLF